MTALRPYNEINALPSMSKQAESEAPAESNGKKAGWLTNVFDVLSDSFRPLLGHFWVPR